MVSNKSPLASPPPSLCSKDSWSQLLFFAKGSLETGTRPSTLQSNCPTLHSHNLLYHLFIENWERIANSWPQRWYLLQIVVPELPGHATQVPGEDFSTAESIGMLP